jgi:hypothetical protein
MEEKEFKKYYLQDYVMAKPMSENEARRLFGESPEQFSEPGYLVEYSNGNKRWISKADFEEVSRIADSFVDRMKIEEDELAEKLQKLLDFTATDKFKGLLRGEQELMRLQDTYMYYYHKTLLKRLSLAEKENDTTKEIEAACLRFNFFEAMCLMKEGCCMGREKWGPMLFVTHEVDRHIQEKDLDNLENLQPEAKELIKISFHKSVGYCRRYTLYDLMTGGATSYSPTIEDVECFDWVLYDAKKS